MVLRLLQKLPTPSCMHVHRMLHFVTVFLFLRALLGCMEPTSPPWHGCAHSHIHAHLHIYNSQLRMHADTTSLRLAGVKREGEKKNTSEECGPEAIASTLEIGRGDTPEECGPEAIASTLPELRRWRAHPCMRSHSHCNN